MFARHRNTFWDKLELHKREDREDWRGDDIAVHIELGIESHKLERLKDLNSFTG